jgi:hypothetical protein
MSGLECKKYQPDGQTKIGHNFREYSGVSNKRGALITVYLGGIYLIFITYVKTV